MTGAVAGWGTPGLDKEGCGGANGLVGSRHFSFAIKLGLNVSLPFLPLVPCIIISPVQTPYIREAGRRRPFVQ
jgi:hypothetical protein